MIESLLRERASAAELTLTDDTCVRLAAYLELLWKWNRKINLTAISDPAKAVDRLLLEPLAAARHLPAGVRLADLGSGGGSPALPLAIALGVTHLLMVESRSRKAAFLREAARVLEIHAEVVAMRFEDLLGRTEYNDAADVISIRAVRPDAITLSLARQLVRPKGLVAIFTSPREGELLSLEYAGCSTWNIAPSAMLITFHVEHP